VALLTCQAEDWALLQVHYVFCHASVASASHISSCVCCRPCTMLLPASDYKAIQLLQQHLGFLIRRYGTRCTLCRIVYVAASMTEHTFFVIDALIKKFLPCIHLFSYILRKVKVFLYFCFSDVSLQNVQGIKFALHAQMKTRLQKVLKRTLQPLKRLLTFNLMPQVGLSSMSSHQAFVCCVQM